MLGKGIQNYYTRRGATNKRQGYNRLEKRDE